MEQRRENNFDYRRRHGGEYPGIQTAIELSQELDPADVQVRYHFCTCPATRAFCKSCGVIRKTEKNLNHVFPGTIGGT